MNDWHKLFSNLGIALFRDGHMVIAVLGKSGIAAPIVGDDSGARRDDALDETAKHIGASIRHHRKSDTSGIATVPTFIECAVVFADPYFNGCGDKSLVVHAF